MSGLRNIFGPNVWIEMFGCFIRLLDLIHDKLNLIHFFSDFFRRIVQSMQKPKDWVEVGTSYHLYFFVDSLFLAFLFANLLAENFLDWWVKSYKVLVGISNSFQNQMDFLFLLFFQIVFCLTFQNIFNSFFFMRIETLSDDFHLNFQQR